MESNYSQHRAENFPTSQGVNSPIPPFVYRDANHWSCCLIAMVFIGVMLIVSFFICYFVSMHWVDLFLQGGIYSNSPPNYQAYYPVLKALIGVGSAALAIGAILILTAFTIKHNRSSRHYDELVRAGKIRTV